MSTCARRIVGGVCGHLEDEHATYCLHPEASERCSECGRGYTRYPCTCNGFRSRDQQEAWDALGLALEAHRGEVLAGRPNSAPGLVEIAKRILEVNP
jgi:hypothetical protein